MLTTMQWLLNVVGKVLGTTAKAREFRCEGFCVNIEAVKSCLFLQGKKIRPRIDSDANECATAAVSMVAAMK